MSSNGDSPTPHPYQRILVGTDGSITAGKAVDQAVDVAKAHEATLTILSAGRRADDVLLTEAERVREAGIEPTLRSVNGDAAHALIAEAREGDHDLLVVGNKGLAGFRRLNPLGSVPGKLSHHLPCAMLVVKTT
jgi:nucleotide-binding universal stress UspA family protein